MPKKNISIELALSESDWAEIYYALDSKRCFVQQGFYHCMNPSDKRDDKKWSSQLGRILRTLKQQFQKNKVTY